MRKPTWKRRERRILMPAANVSDHLNTLKVGLFGEESACTDIHLSLNSDSIDDLDPKIILCDLDVPKIAETLDLEPEEIRFVISSKVHSRKSVEIVYDRLLNELDDQISLPKNSVYSNNCDIKLTFTLLPTENAISKHKEMNLFVTLGDRTVTILNTLDSPTFPIEYVPAESLKAGCLWKVEMISSDFNRPIDSIAKILISDIVDPKIERIMDSKPLGGLFAKFILIDVEYQLLVTMLRSNQYVDDENGALNYYDQKLKNHFGSSIVEEREELERDDEYIGDLYEMVQSMNNFADSVNKINPRSLR